MTDPVEVIDREWLTCLGCGWIKSVHKDPPVNADGHCVTCGEPAEDPFQVAQEDRAMLSAAQVKP